MADSGLESVSAHLDADQLQLGLEDAEVAPAQAEAASEAKTVRTPGDRPRKVNRGALPAQLERIEQVVDVEDKACPCCGGGLHKIGEDVSERLDVCRPCLGAPWPENSAYNWLA